MYPTAPRMTIMIRPIIHPEIPPSSSLDFFWHVARQQYAPSFVNVLVPLQVSFEEHTAPFSPSQVSSEI